MVERLEEVGRRCRHIRASPSAQIPAPGESWRRPRPSTGVPKCGPFIPHPTCRKTISDRARSRDRPMRQEEIGRRSPPQARRPKILPCRRAPGLRGCPCRSGNRPPRTSGGRAEQEKPPPPRLRGGAGGQQPAVAEDHESAEERRFRIGAVELEEVSSSSPESMSSDFRGAPTEFPDRKHKRQRSWTSSGGGGTSP